MNAEYIQTSEGHTTIDSQLYPIKCDSKRPTSNIARLFDQNVQCNYWWEHRGCHGVQTYHKTKNLDKSGSNPLSIRKSVYLKGLVTRLKKQTQCFLPHNNIPENRRKYVTYSRIVVDYWPQKYDPCCTCFTVGVNIFKYPGDIITRTPYLTTAKLLFNSTISIPEAHFMCCEIKNFIWEPPWNGMNKFPCH